MSRRAILNRDDKEMYREIEGTTVECVGMEENERDDGAKFSQWEVFVIQREGGRKQ